MTTIATGGYSTHDASIGYYDSPLIETISVTFMVVGSLPFLLYVKAIHGRPDAIWRWRSPGWQRAATAIRRPIIW